MDCLFCNIVEHHIPAKIIFEDDEICAFRDINPQAPTHCLIIPKKHISTINDACDEDAILLGKMILAAKKVANDEGHSENGYRLVFNINAHAGQTVFHIHLHVLGGRMMSWPPG